MSKTSAARPPEKNKNGNAPKGVAVSYDLSKPDFSIPFFHYLTIPKNTSRAVPLTYDMKLPLGMIYRLWVEFPKGCSGLVGFRMERATIQIFPLPDGVWLRSDNSVMSFGFTHPIRSEPHEVKLYGYNLDDTYDHTIWVGLEMRGFAKDMPPELQSFIKTLTG